MLWLIGILIFTAPWEEKSFTGTHIAAASGTGRPGAPSAHIPFATVVDTDHRCRTAIGFVEMVRFDTATTNVDRLSWRSHTPARALFVLGGQDRTAEASGPPRCASGVAVTLRMQAAGGFGLGEMRMGSLLKYFCSYFLYIFFVINI